MYLHPTHNWRYSDSSLYDAVCLECNYTDTSPQAKLPCGQVLKEGRLLVLAKEAGLKHSSEINLSLQEEKFAKLVVKECMTIMENEFWEDPQEAIDLLMEKFQLDQLDRIQKTPYFRDGEPTVTPFFNVETTPEGFLKNHSTEEKPRPSEARPRPSPPIIKGM